MTALHGAAEMFVELCHPCWSCAPPVSPSANGVVGPLTLSQVITIGTALLSAAVVVITLLVNAARTRRDFFANLFAEALAAVAEYLEGPYRVLRKDGTTATRFTITSHLSDVKTSIDRYQELLRLHASRDVSDAYDAYVIVAKIEAGNQMKDAWRAKPIRTDAQVNLGTALPRTETDAARPSVVASMQSALDSPWWKPRRN